MNCTETSFIIKPTDVSTWTSKDANRNTSDLFEIPTLWILIDILLLLIIILGNTGTLLSVSFNRKLQDILSNQFIISLAVSDLIVGLTLGFHLAFHLEPLLSVNKTTCMLRFSFISFAFCMSFYNMVVVAVYRYVAVKRPLFYVAMVSQRYAVKVIQYGWVLGIIYGLIPMVWNRWSPCQPCEFVQVIPIWIIRYVLAPSIILPWLVLIMLYLGILYETAKHGERLRANVCSGARDNDYKSVQLVLLILGSFSLTWIPYLCVIVIQTFMDIDLAYKITFSLAMANSGVNPVIYAWMNIGFRKSFISLLHCRSPSLLTQNSSMRTCITEVNNTSLQQKRENQINSKKNSQIIEPQTNTDMVLHL